MPVFHVGFQKTGTTHLQEKLFPLHRYFVGHNAPSYPVEFKILADLGRLFQGNSPREFNESHLVGILESAGNHRLASEALFSYENLVRSPFLFSDRFVGLLSSGKYEQELDRWVFASRLKWLRSFFPGPDAPIFLLTVRDQASALASLYAQQSHQIKSASQSHFEDSVYAYLEYLQNGDRRSHLNFSFVANSILNEFQSGGARVFFIPNEKLSTPEFLAFFETISSSQLPVKAKQRYLSASRTYSRFDGSSWELRPPRKHKTRRVARISLNEALIADVKAVFAPLNLAISPDYIPLGLGEDYI